MWNVRKKINNKIKKILTTSNRCPSGMEDVFATLFELLEDTVFDFFDNKEEEFFGLLAAGWEATVSVTMSSNSMSIINEFDTF